jgi:hypothetical protein
MIPASAYFNHTLTEDKKMQISKDGQHKIESGSLYELRSNGPGQAWYHIAVLPRYIDHIGQALSWYENSCESGFDED